MIRLRDMCQDGLILICALKKLALPKYILTLLIHNTMEIFYKRITKGILLCFIILASISFNTAAQQCSLGKGDLIITGYDLQDDETNGVTQDDKFSFVLLRDIPINTDIFFTDYGWTGAAFQLDAQAVGDGMIKWTSDKAYSAGTEIYIYCKYS